MPYVRDPWCEEQTGFSELDTLATCEERWWLRYPMGDHLKPTIAMQRGTALHEMIGPWWEKGLLPDFAQVIADNELELPEEERDKVLWLVGRYVQVNESFRPKVRVIATEGELRALIPGTSVTAVSHLDQIWEVDGLLWVVERKSMASWKRLELVPYTIQESLYIWQAQQAGYDVHGLCFDAIKTYRWVPEKPTQQAMIDAVEESAFGPPWGPLIGKDDPDKLGKQLTLAGAKRQWARAVVAAHPGVDRPAEESFERIWTDRTPQQIERALDWARTVLRRRDVLIAGENPIRNIGNDCGSCSAQADCFAGLQFAATIELEDEADFDDVD